MIAGMDDRDDPQELITMEAMSGLARIFEQIDERHVRPILINIALRIRPCFERVCCVFTIILHPHKKYRKSGNFHVQSFHAIIFRVKIFSYASRPYENILTEKSTTKI